MLAGVVVHYYPGADKALTGSDLPESPGGVDACCELNRATRHDESPTAGTSVSTADEQPLTLDGIPEGPVREVLLAMDPDLRSDVLREIKALDIPDNDFDSLRLHPGGRLFYVCDLDVGGPSTRMTSARSEPVSQLQYSLACPLFIFDYN